MYVPGEGLNVGVVTVPVTAYSPKATTLAVQSGLYAFALMVVVVFKGTLIGVV